MGKAGAIVGSALTLLKRSVEPGMTTRELDNIAYKAITQCGGKPTFKGYRGFPYTLCVSVNEEVVHGMPSKDRILKEGDIVSLDFGVIYKGFYG